MSYVKPVSLSVQQLGSSVPVNQTKVMFFLSQIGQQGDDQLHQPRRGEDHSEGIAWRFSARRCHQRRPRL